MQLWCYQARGIIIRVCTCPKWLLGKRSFSEPFFPGTRHSAWRTRTKHLLGMGLAFYLEASTFIFILWRMTLIKGLVQGYTVVRLGLTPSSTWHQILRCQRRVKRDSSGSHCKSARLSGTLVWMPPAYTDEDTLSPPGTRRNCSSNEKASWLSSSLLSRAGPCYQLHGSRMRRQGPAQDWRQTLVLRSRREVSKRKTILPDVWCQSAALLLGLPGRPCWGSKCCQKD